MRMLALVLASALAAPVIAGAGPLRIAREKSETVTGKTEARSTKLYPIEPGAIGVVFRQPVVANGAVKLQLHFRIGRRPATAPWALVVRDRTGAAAWSLASLEPPEDDVWSEEVGGDTADVELVAVADVSDLQIEIDKVVVFHEVIKPQAITPPDERKPILSQSAQMKTWGRSVVRLRFVGDDGLSYTCTGFVVSRELLMTNHHCIQSRAEMKSAQADFDYDAERVRPTTVRFRELVLNDQALDYALLRFKAPTDRPPLAIKAGTAVVAQDQGLLVIEHPGGETKQVSIAGCKTDHVDLQGVGDAMTDFGHLCDTLGGSSGSPVADINDGAVIGLHHLGFNDGSPMPVNQAVKIGLILDDIKKKLPAVYTEIRPGS